jgi:Domain of unknown function (DUF4337)
MSTNASKSTEGSSSTIRTLATDKDFRDRWIGVYIAVVAVLLAICTMSGGNATKEANRLNIEAANVWNFFQAKNARRNNVRLTTDQLELQLAAQPAMPEAAKQAYLDKIKANKELDKRLTSDPSTKEGLDELFAKGKELERQRDDAFKRDPFFDWAQTALQIAIVLASVCLITANVSLLLGSGVLAIIGTLLMLNGLTVVLPIPFIG